MVVATAAAFLLVTLLVNPAFSDQGFICPGNGNYPNPDDCSSFLVCTVAGNRPVSISCPRDLYYNPETNACDNAENVDCGRSNTKTTTTTTTTTLRPDVTQQPFKCPPTGIESFKNPTDCGSFYICYNGKLDVITCPRGTEFNEIKGQCEDPNTAGCSQPRPPTEPSNPPESTTKSNVADCSHRPDGDVFPNPKDCSQFFQCSNGLMFALSCPPGLEFNAIDEVCDNPTFANCQETRKR